MLLKGNCLDLLKTLPDNSVDSIVTDPPYGLEFMGRDWDAPWKQSEVVEVTDKATNGIFHDKGFKNGIRYSRGTQEMVAFQLWFTEIAEECFRVLKPGGHILSFGGSRTYHRMAVAIEDAGFEIRDSIHWTYGSGFPKSMDISKAIDKQGGENIGWFIDLCLKVAEEKGITKKQLTDLFPSKNGKPTGWLYNKASHTQSISPEQFNVLRDFLDLPYADLAEAEREVVGYKEAGMGSGETFGMRQAEGDNASANKTVPITAPATPEAQRWQGWGTAMKPSHEPIVVARKPVEGTVANNVLKYGTGAINIDGTRVGTTKEVPGTANSKGETSGYMKGWGDHTDEMSGKNPNMGRWPANTILTHSSACRQVGETSETVVTTNGKGFAGSFEGGENNNGGAETKVSTPIWECADDCPTKLFPESNGGAFPKKGNTPTGEHYEGGWKSVDNGVRTEMGSGSASRFFNQTEYDDDIDFPPIIYQAKASKADRNAGLNWVRPEEGMGSYNFRVNGSLDGKQTAPKQNIHPTVKPVALMRHLIRLVTPPNGVVLDPFLGSGTTAVAAILENCQWIGCEMTEDYYDIIEKRVEWAMYQANAPKQESLF